jgi:hypothetical protein
VADEDPEIQAQVDRLWARVLATLEANKLQFNEQLLRLLGLMSVEFNVLERDFKYLLMLLRDDLPLGEAQKTALKIKTFASWLSRNRTEAVRLQAHVKRVIPGSWRSLLPALRKTYRR